MNLKLRFSLIVLLVFSLGGLSPIWAEEPQSSDAGQEKPAAPAVDMDKMMYALGVVMAQQLSFYRLNDEEFEDVVRGLKDGYNNSEEAKGIDMQTYGMELRTLAQERSQAYFKEAAAEERASSSEFLAAAATEEGAQKTSTGLVYKELSAGSGDQPTATDTVKVHYKGTLRDGTVFDSSYDRGQPATFPLNQVIKCWTEGLQMMKVGGKSKLVCPADIAYGDRGTGNIKPGSTLVFEVELLDIVKEPAPEPAVAPSDS